MVSGKIEMPFVSINKMPRFLSKSFTSDKDNIYERYLLNITDEDEQLKLLPNNVYCVANGFYKIPSGKKVFVFNYDVYEGTEYMYAWCYYNFASNLRKKKMNGEQYRFWRHKMEMEGKGHLLYD